MTSVDRTRIEDPLPPEPANPEGDADGGLQSGGGRLDAGRDGGGQAIIADAGARRLPPASDGGIADAALQDAALQDAALQDAALQDTALQDAALQDAAAGLGDGGVQSKDAAAPG